MTDTKTYLAAPGGFLARLMKSRERAPGRDEAGSVGYSSVVSFGRAEPTVGSRELDTDFTAKTGGVGGLFVAQGQGLMPRDPVAHPKYKPRLAGAVQKIYQRCDEPVAATTVEELKTYEVPVAEPPALGYRAFHPTMEVDIAAFVEAVSAAYPQPRDPDVRPVLKARPKGAARPLYLAESQEESATPSGVIEEASKPVAWDGEAAQKAHQERELRAFHEFLDRMESAPLESLDRPLADLDESVEVRRYFAAPLAPYDPILDVAIPVSVAREAAPVPVEDRPSIVEAVIEPQEPMGNPRLPGKPAESLGGLPQRLSPSQRAHLKRPVTLRDRHGRIAPVTYSLTPKAEF